MEHKVLVGITIQENSRRLILEGSNLAKSLNAPFHILHIRKGDTVFDIPESSALLEDLFTYGGELGGEVHFLCSNHVTQTIIDFIKENEITHLVVGEAPTQLANHLTVGSKLLDKLSDIQITVLPRQAEALGTAY